jgi:hypothetical protein
MIASKRWELWWAKETETNVIVEVEIKVEVALLFVARGPSPVCPGF